MRKYNFDVVAVGGGGGGAVGCCSAGGGGGGGEVVVAQCGVDNIGSFGITLGKGGASCCVGGIKGGYTCITYNGTPFLYAKGGYGAIAMLGGHSGSNKSGMYLGCLCGYYMGGGGGGAGCRGGQTSPLRVGQGGAGICGYGGGGNGGGYFGGTCYGQVSCNGGGLGGRCVYGGCTGGAGTNGGGGGGGYCINGGKGGNGLVKICYKSDGSCGFTTATGGTITTEGDYKVHTFTSNGTFTIVS